MGYEAPVTGVVGVGVGVGDEPNFLDLVVEPSASRRFERAIPSPTVARKYEQKEH
jgi:hypothetical protein